MMKYYIFKITYWDKYPENEVHVAGLVSAKSYSEALELILCDYEEEDICSIDSIQEIESICQTLPLNDAMYRMFHNAHNEEEIDSYHIAKSDGKGKTYLFHSKEGKNK